MRIAGLDVSLTGTGVAIIDTDLVKWDGNWEGVETAKIGVNLPRGPTSEQKVERLHRIAGGVVDYLKKYKVSKVFVEDYSYGSPFGAHQLGELGGVMRYVIYTECHIVLRSFPIATVRKLFLGYVAKGAKQEVARVLKELGAPFDKDEGDAFVVANYALSEMGIPCLMKLSPPQERVPKKRKILQTKLAAEDMEFAVFDRKKKL